MRILAVDDSENARDIMRATLASGGFEDVVFAASGGEAVAAVRAAAGAPFDVILLDVVMPEMDGIEACAQIRADGRYADVPILMVTSQSDMDTLAQAFVAGANDYVTKPFQRTELLARIRSAFRFKGEMDRRRAREAELLALADKLHRGFADVGALIDGVTGTLTRDVAEAALRSLAPGQGGQPAVVAVQVDGLGAYRSRYGDGGVSTMLARLGDALRAVPGRAGDLLSYFGDGLFIIVAQGAGGNAQRVGDGALGQVTALKLANGESSSGFVTVSVGVALSRAGDSREPRMLLADAISAVEQAVSAGGNRIVLSEAPLIA